jgi:hypothetical protein
MVAKLTRLTHRIAIQLHLVAENCTIWSSHSRWPVWKLLDTPSYIPAVNMNNTYLQPSSWKYSLAMTWYAAARVSSHAEPSAANVTAKPPELMNLWVCTTASGANKWLNNGSKKAGSYTLYPYFVAWEAYKNNNKGKVKGRGKVVPVPFF